MLTYTISPGPESGTFHVRYCGPTSETSGAVDIVAELLDRFTTELEKLGYCLVQGGT